jgi:hypothetical protein
MLSGLCGIYLGRQRSLPCGFLTKQNHKLKFGARGSKTVKDALRPISRYYLQTEDRR